MRDSVPALRFYAARVKSGKAQSEHMFSRLPPIADIRLRGCVPTDGQHCRKIVWMRQVQGQERIEPWPRL